jgi:hypothetical protein
MIGAEELAVFLINLDVGVTAKANVAAQAGTADVIYHKLLADDPETHWDQIVSDMHTKDPWTDLIGVNRDVIPS